MAIHHVVIYSGGMDSFVLLNKVMIERASSHLREEHSLRAISFNYGQRHAKELDCAAAVCGELGISHTVIQLAELGHIAYGSALTDKSVEVPLEHYSANSIKLTVVPGRNTVMLAMALAYTEGLLNQSNKPNTDHAIIYYGAHADDRITYPDCRPQYIQAMAHTIYLASDRRVDLQAPLRFKTKAEVLKDGLRLGIRLADFAKTWSCYVGGDRPCGQCGTCHARAEAFAANKVDDPLLTS